MQWTGKRIRICFSVLWIFYYGCDGTLELSPSDTVPLPAVNENPAGQNDGQTLVFQIHGDISIHQPFHFNVVLPNLPLESQIFIFGQRLNRLHYSELPLHSHEGEAALTDIEDLSHTHRLYTNSFVLNPIAFGGAASVALNGQCGTYALQSATNPGCSGKNLVEATNLAHAHTILPQIGDTGISAEDENGEMVPVATTAKNFCDHLEVFLNGENISPKFNINPIGDGTSTHPLHSQGINAPLTDTLTTAGHHRISFRINEALATISHGCGLNAILWVRIPQGPWAEGVLP